MLLSDLLRDVRLTKDIEAGAIAQRKEAEERLINGLALIGTPLLDKGRLVIGDTLVSRPYVMLGLELSQIENVPVDSVVVSDREAVTPHSDLPL